MVQRILFFHFYHGSYSDVDTIITGSKLEQMHFEHQRSSCWDGKIDIVEALNLTN
jgi:hypothetical protein